MEQMLETALYISGFILLFVLVILYGRHMVAKTNFAWQEAANKLGLNFTPTPWGFGQYEMRGTIEGCQCRIHTYTVNHGGSGENSKRNTYTEFNVILPQPLDLGLRISSAGFFSGFTKMMGAQDIQVDFESDFDKSLTIKGNDENDIKDFLTPERKEKILAAYHFMPGLKMDDDSLSWTNTGVTRNPDSIVENVTQLTDLAGLLTTKEEIDSIFR